MKTSKSTYLDIRGLRYHVRSWGREGAPKIFMLHGWMDASASFQFFADSLKGDWEIIAPDLRGYGQTQWQGSDTYWFFDYVLDLDLILDHFQPDAPVNLVAHSFGGNIAAIYAGSMPQRVARFVNIDAFGPRSEGVKPARLEHKAAKEGAAPVEEEHTEIPPKRYAEWLDRVKKGSRFKDFEAFADLAAEDVVLHADEELGSHLVDAPVAGLRTGYINQEIVKLAFWELGLADNYFTVDSDAVFIRNFATSDFMRDATTPYTVLVQDLDLKVQPRYYREHWVGREASIRRIQEAIGLDDPIVRTCHGHQVMSAAVLRSLREEFLAPREWDYADALALAPLEYSWYCLWLQRTHVIPIHQIEPLVKVFHNEDQHLDHIVGGLTLDDLARGYLAVVVNSNFSRDLGLMPAAAAKPQALAPYLSYGETARLLTAKVKDTWARRAGGSGPQG